MASKTNSVSLTKPVHEAFMALGTCAAITPNTDSHRSKTSRQIGDPRRLYYLAARCILAGIEFDFETLFLTPQSKVEEARLLKRYQAFPQQSRNSFPEGRLNKICAELFGGSSWVRLDNDSYRYMDMEARCRLSEQVQNLDWCNQTLSRLVETGVTEASVIDRFVTIFMIGMKARCPVQEFPSQWSVFGSPRTMDELKVIGFSASIREKPEWRKKLRDEHIVAKWREEAYAQDVTPSMFDFMIAELHWLAEQIDPETGIDFATVPGVFFSNSLICLADRDALRSGAEALSAVPEDEKDWHPKSNGQVLDLVHPSLYPYVHGRTTLLQRPESPEASRKLSAVMGDENTTSVMDMMATSILRSLRPELSRGLISSPKSALSFVGQGSPTSNLPPGLSIVERRWSDYSRYQWLPADVEVSQGPARSVRFLSYINNLHPGSAPGDQLYPVLERIFARFIPLFERTLTETRRRPKGDDGVRSEFLNGPVMNSQNYISELTSDDHGNDQDYMDDREFVRPIVAPFVVPGPPGPALVKLEGQNLQVIVKMANIQLTPEKPVYEGGSWHVEGTDSERIVATGIYYFDSENIRLPFLEFRQAVEEPLYEQSDFYHLEFLYGIKPDGEDGSSTNQYLGAVGTPEGQCICFPNGVQHRLVPFELMDYTKPGHRKILVFFLVDPSERILSTSDVPPQQLEWFLRELRKQGDNRLSSLPLELFDMICKHAQTKTLPLTKQSPVTGLMSLSEALKHRLTLMDERANFIRTVNETMYECAYNLCEH